MLDGFARRNYTWHEVKTTCREDILTEERQPSIDWPRIYALPYNHFFENELKQMRSYLELPEEGISDRQQAWAWLEKHLTGKRPQPWFELKPSPLDVKL